MCLSRLMFFGQVNHKNITIVNRYKAPLLGGFMFIVRLFL